MILKATYGYTTEPHSPDPLVDLVDEVMRQFSLAFVPGKWAVDIIPALKHLPRWLPGSGFQLTAQLWKKTMTDVINLPFEYAKLTQHEQDGPSFVAKSLAQQDQEKGDLTPKDLHAIRFAAASLYTGGIDVELL
jgi:hypothetical protein